MGAFQGPFFMPMMLRRTLLALAATLVSVPLAQAQSAWPTKPVRIVVPAPAGSSLDIIARLLGDSVRQEHMRRAARQQSSPEAAEKIAEEIAHVL